MAKKEKLTTMKQESIKKGLTKPMSSKRPKSWEGGSVVKSSKSFDLRQKGKSGFNSFDVAIGTEALKAARAAGIPESKASKLAKGIRTRGGKSRGGK